MNSAVLLHGCCDKEEYFSDTYPSPSNSHWFPWMQKQLLMKGILTQNPEMPTPYSPEYKKWKEVFERLSIDKNTVLVGHSCGGGFLLRYLSENKIHIKKLILVAPWLDPIKKRKGFLDFRIDEKIEKRTKEIHVLISEDEPVEGVRESVDLIQKTFPNALFHKFQNMGTSAMKK